MKIFATGRDDEDRWRQHGRRGHGAAAVHR